MIKVIQSAGRVIRTEDDRGKILLIDKRFSLPPYKFLLPHHWQIFDYEILEQMNLILGNFNDVKSLKNRENL